VSAEAVKVTASHLARNAYLYIRQSTLKQVLHNTESTARQYDLRGKAIALGWDASQITVIDIDQGQSGASAADREGFQQLVAEVSLGRAGIVLGLECSRLARNNADWYRLLDLAGMTGTLIADADGVYHPGLFNDRAGETGGQQRQLRPRLGPSQGLHPRSRWEDFGFEEHRRERR